MALSLTTPACPPAPSWSGLFIPAPGTWGCAPVSSSLCGEGSSRLGEIMLAGSTHCPLPPSAPSWALPGSLSDFCRMSCRSCHWPARSPHSLLLRLTVGGVLAHAADTWVFQTLRSSRLLSGLRLPPALVKLTPNVLIQSLLKCHLPGLPRVGSASSWRLYPRLCFPLHALRLFC